MKQKLRSASLWFTILSLTASALNFLYYPVVARFLNLPQFGDVQIGVTFIMQAAALFSSLNLVALFLSTNRTNTENLTQRLERILIIPSFLAAIIVTVFAVPISHTLQLHDPGLLYLLAFIFMLNIPASTWVGTLQGEGSFIKSGVIAVIAATTKIVASVLFISLGLGAYGAILGILLGTAVIIPLCYFAQKSNQLSFVQTFRFATKRDFTFVAKNKPVIYILLAFILLTLVSTFDVFFAKLHLNPAAAGLFSQLSIIAKIPYFAFLPISIILFNQFILRPDQRKRSYALFCIAITVASAGVYLILTPVAKLLFDIDLTDTTRNITLALLVAFLAFTVISLSLYLLVSRGQTITALYLAGMAFVSALITLPMAGNALTLAVNYAMTLTVLMLLSFGALRYTRNDVKEN